jgi:hypothetical protein
MPYAVIDARWSLDRDCMLLGWHAAGFSDAEVAGFMGFTVRRIQERLALLSRKEARCLTQ